jgi:hypothetical protein
MDEADTIKPLGLFSLDALRAGWYLSWRQLIRVVPAGIGVVLLGGLLGWLGSPVLVPIVSGVGLLAVSIWAMVLVPRLTIQWAEQWYGATLTGQVRIWWGVVWRVFVASLVAAVIFTPPQFVATSLSTSFTGAALGMVGGLLTVLLALANAIVSLLATGWGMSKVAVAQIATLEAITGLAAPGVFSSAPEPLPVAASVAAAPVVAAAAPAAAAAPTATAVAPAPASRAAGGTRQCPKCGLHETERGTVIGWYCRVCGWREGRGR